LTVRDEVMRRVDAEEEEERRRQMISSTSATLSQSPTTPSASSP